MTLGQPDTPVISEEIAVIKSRARLAKGAMQQQLSESRFQQICPPHDFGDAHGGVIHHTGELITGGIVLSPDKKITKVPTGDRVPGTSQSIGEFQ